MDGHATRRWVEAGNPGLKMTPYEAVMHGHICDNCNELDIGWIATPLGQPHKNNVQSLVTSAQVCPLCNLFLTELLAGIDRKELSENVTLTCYLQIDRGIASIRLIPAEGPKPTRSGSFSTRVYAEQGKLPAGQIRLQALTKFA